ncbi:MAG: hypothetical protein SPE50_06730 [Evtepia sp.]|nr:hypothetical protein [Evtepia sp.]
MSVFNLGLGERIRQFLKGFEEGFHGVSLQLHLLKQGFLRIIARIRKSIDLERNPLFFLLREDSATMAKGHFLSCTMDLTDRTIWSSPPL